MRKAALSQPISDKKDHKQLSPRTRRHPPPCASELPSSREGASFQHRIKPHQYTAEGVSTSSHPHQDDLVNLFFHFSCSMYLTPGGLKHPKTLSIPRDTYSDPWDRKGLPRWLSGKELACQHRKHQRPGGSIHGPGRFPRGGNGNPLQYSCLE